MIEKGEMVQNPSFRAHQRNYFDSISSNAAQAQRTSTMGSVATIAPKPSHTKSTTVDVNINKVEVNSSASSITGTVTDAMQAAQNSFYQLVGSMN